MYRHRHHRLQQLRAAFCQCRLDRLGAGAMERHFRGILGMGLSIDQADLDADHRMSLRAFRQCSAHALLHRRDEAARHHATDDAIVEHDLTVLARRHVQHHLRELLGGVQAAARGHGRVQLLALQCRLAPQLTGRHVGVLRLQYAWRIPGRSAGCCQHH
ncbi:hypothetical protein G6F23_013755 [Rhizopus arrhizus]|nr:hypothetical protein G6F23_013755 [Rhizopus arrhizus]